MEEFIVNGKVVEFDQSKSYRSVGVVGSCLVGEVMGPYYFDPKKYLKRFAGDGQIGMLIPNTMWELAYVDKLLSDGKLNNIDWPLELTEENKQDFINVKEFFEKILEIFEEE